MSSLHYTNAYTFGQTLSDKNGYSQVVKLPGTGVVKISGQGGWDQESGALADGDHAGQVEQAFRNVETTLKAAGLRGWDDVYLVRSYHIDIDKSLSECTKNYRAFASHRPVWTAIGVPRLGRADMLIEIEVEAYDGSN